MIVSARTGVKILAALVAVCGIIAVALFVIVQSRQFKVWLQAETSRRSGYDVRFDRVSLRFPFVLAADTVELTKPGAVQFKTDRITVSLSPFAIWSKTIDRLALERPTLSLDLDEIIKTSGPSSADVAVRSLHVGNGAIIIKKGREVIFELAQIDLNAQNLNLGQVSGLTLRADLPALKSEAEINVKGRLRDWQTAISVQAKQSDGLLGGLVGKNQASDFLRANVRVRAPEGQTASAVIETKFHNFAIDNLKLTGTLDARAELDADFKEIDFSGSAALNNFPDSISPTPLRISNGDATATFAGGFSPASKTLQVTTLRVSSTNVRIDGDGQINFAGAKPKIVAAKLTLRDLPLETFKSYLPEPFSHWSYVGHAQITLDAKGLWDALAVQGNLSGDKAQVRGEEFNLAQLAFFARFDWTKPGWRISEVQLAAAKIAYNHKNHWQTAAAAIELGGFAEWQANQPLKLSGTLQADGVKFNSPDSARAGENLNLTGSFQILSDPSKKLISLHGRIASVTGELLWDQWFVDLKGQTPTIDLAADYLSDQDRLECRQCSLTVASMGRIETTGFIEKLTEQPVLQLRAQSENFSPSGFFNFILRNNLNRQYPVLEKLALDGQLNFKVALQGKLDALRASGELALHGGEVRATSNEWQIGPITVMLPFQIQWANTAPIEQEKLPLGTLGIDRIRFANQTVAPFSTTISLANNALHFHQPVRLRMFGGEIDITNLLWPDVIKAPRQFSFSAETKHLQLQELTDVLGWPRFSGSLSGSIPQVHSSREVLSTRGEIQADLFGGRVQIGKMEIDNPFSGLASIKLDAKLTAIQLELLSQTFAFGRISGILEGSIDNLVLTDGQIAEMRADLHSVDRGGEQRISVEALNKITVLSSGEDVGGLYGGLASFFDSFRYSKLGFKANLKNDRLTLRGVESDGDKELLVVGSFLPPTVNIISHTQNIAFSELLRRLARIQNEKPSVK